MTTRNSVPTYLHERPTEECGVCAVVGHPEAAKLTCLGLYSLQHRGQETAGIVSASRNGNGCIRHSIHRGLGLVREIFTEEDLAHLEGEVAIGHVRYSTTGQPIPANTQPLASSLRFGPVALAHNGNLTNARELREDLKQAGAIFQTTIDSEAILHQLTHVRHADIEECLADALPLVEGAYSLVMLHNDVLYAVRDPRGFRPLVLGQLPNGAHVVASETIAFDLLDAKLIRDVEPGEVIRIAPGEEPVSLPLLERKETAHCIFELVYFSRPDSVVDGRHVQEVRERLGAELWHEQPADVDVVMGVPDSSTAAAVGYARAGKIPYEMGLIRNHYIGRTFIEPHQIIRDFRAKLKYNPVRSIIQGKRVAVIDDSIVRGTTCCKIARMLYDAGAKEVHFRITAPPWRHACFYGIDTPDERKLMANNATVEQMRDQIGCDSLRFLTPDALTRAVRETEGWCMACFTGKYPTVRPENLTKETFEEDDPRTQWQPNGNTCAKEHHVV
ncbi:amidophosphoribosyltransferase [bacterium]|nr:amidophosphoribosyltransferase [bacterium]